MNLRQKILFFTNFLKESLIFSKRRKNLIKNLPIYKVLLFLFLKLNFIDYFVEYQQFTNEAFCKRIYKKIFDKEQQKYIIVEEHSFFEKKNITKQDLFSFIQNFEVYFLYPTTIIDLFVPYGFNNSFSFKKILFEFTKNPLIIRFYSTNRGILIDKECISLNIGGVLLFNIKT